MADGAQVDFRPQGMDAGALDRADSNPADDGATLMFQMAPGLLIPYEYTGVRNEIAAYRDSAWIGTTLMISPVYDVIGPDAAEFLSSICVNDFATQGMETIRHAVICNDEGQLLTDGVVLRIDEERFRTYWLNPPIDFLLAASDLDVRSEDLTGQEYFIQIAGERSLEILEDALRADLHDLRFARHRLVASELGCEVRVVRLGMSGNLAYEIHGPMSDYARVYDAVWASGRRFGARKLGMHAYNLFNHTEAGFPNIHLHYPLPWFESGEELAGYLRERPQLGSYNLNRHLTGSVGDDLTSRFVTPYDLGWGRLVRFTHEFRGRAALERIAQDPLRTVAILEWDADDVGAAFADMIRPGDLPCDDISRPCDLTLLENSALLRTEYRADRVLLHGEDVGIATGRIISYNYGVMISLGFIRPDLAVEGTELTVLWGTPGTRQREIRVRVARYPYNGDMVRNEDRDVSEIPRRRA